MAEIFRMIIRSIPRRSLYISAFVVLILFFALSLKPTLFDVSYSPVLYARDGSLLGAQVAKDGQWRFPPPEALNERFVIALIEAEDRRFWRHPGVDPLAVIRAAYQNIRYRQVVSGASTLTMQTIRLSRNASAPGGVRPRTMLEKGVEAVLALRLEMSKSKDEILRLYAAHAPFGANVVGIEAASWRWFGRSSEDLSWAEAATLAVLPNSPALIHPGRNREALQRRRDTLLGSLHSRGHFDSETLHLARAERLPGQPHPLPRLAPHLLSRLVIEAGGVGAFSGERLPVMVTTIDRDIQERAAEIMNRATDRFSSHGIMNAAALIINTRTGEVYAYVGNTITPQAADVNIVTSWRSSGSLLKPFLYAAMLDTGDILPASLKSDIPTRVGSFSPQNMSRTYLGVVPADQALARSLNVPAARALRTYGVDRFARLLRAMGITTLFRPGYEYGLPLVLGGAEVTLWEITGLYAGLGRAVHSRGLAGETETFFPPAVFPRGSLPLNTRHGQQPLISPGAAWLTLEALVSTARPGEEARWQEHASARRIAWKTGTSFGFRDAWAIGVTPEWTVGVWIGNATGVGRSELRSVLTSAPVMFELFSALDAIGAGRARWFPQPAVKLRSAETCAASGFLAGPNCADVRVVDIPRYASASRACPHCRLVVLNASGNRRVMLGTGAYEATITRNWFALPPAEEWFFRRWNLDYRPLPPLEDFGRITAANAVMPGEWNLALFNPEPGAQIFVPRELDGREGRIVFSAAHRNEAEIIHWHLDGDFLGITQTFHQMEARPSAGARMLTLVDGGGNMLSRHFTVLQNVE
ncbi:MAG: penicillin-binding protein 1C [Treponema sp.]|jgi:penicillin-binding protein 1C|nr:penicillin-binding protein 1C [Treponema sp.]